MKIQVWDSFNFSETNSLFNELIKDSILSKNIPDKSKDFITQKVFEDTEKHEQDKTVSPDYGNADLPVFENREYSDPEASENDQIPRGETDGLNILERSLSEMCKRGDFHSAVIADLNGLPVAVFNSPVNDEIIAACSTILGESLEKAASLLNQPDANNISLDINILDKIVLRKFTPDKTPYYLMVIASQTIDERAEVEIVLRQISQILQ